MQPPGIGYQFVPFIDTKGLPMKTRKGTEAKRAELAQAVKAKLGEEARRFGKKVAALAAAARRLK